MKMKFKINWQEKQDMSKKKIKASFFFDKLNQEVRWLCKGRRGRVYNIIFLPGLAKASSTVYI
jgi:hypothetical protein